MVKCRLCEHANPPGVQRCEKCGTRLDDQEATESNTEPTEQPQTPSDDNTEDEFEARLLAELRAGRKIAAIKLYRESTGAGLKEAKDAVEELAARSNIVAQGGGCAGVLLLLLVSATVTAALW